MIATQNFRPSECEPNTQRNTHRQSHRRAQMLHSHNMQRAWRRRQEAESLRGCPRRRTARTHSALHLIPASAIAGRGEKYIVYSVHNSKEPTAPSRSDLWRCTAVRRSGFAVRRHGVRDASTKLPGAQRQHTTARERMSWNSPTG